jgi:hypothetical protein
MGNVPRDWIGRCLMKAANEIKSGATRPVAKVVKNITDTLE